MFRPRNNQDLRRLVSKIPNYATNQVVITTVPQARNDDLPQSLSVAAGVAPANSFGDTSIDGILYRMGLPARSMSRVYAPRTAASFIATASRATIASNPISADYQDDEDALGLSRTYKIVFEADVNVLHVCHELEQSTAIAKVRPNYLSEIYATPSDEFYGVQWGLQAIDAEAGWDIETGHPNVVIAIVDSGIDLNHDDLKDKLIPGEDFVSFQGNPPGYTLLGDYQVPDLDPDDEDGHGTHCAGISAAASNNRRGISGVCWGGKILPVRVMFHAFDRSEGRETSIGWGTDIEAGIKFAVDSGANVINLSLGGGDRDEYESILQYAHDRNVCVIAATGNENTSFPPTPSYPAANRNTLAVGAINPSFNRADFSNYGRGYAPFVMAPGVQIASTYKENGYVYLDGTSMATPFVTGLAGLIVSLALRSGKQLAVDEIYRIIRETATPLGSGKGDTFYGEGLINVPAALRAAQQALA